jgi:DNA-binding SARP family transcriptional activator/tetratricopeptide (TPR) repeat protein
MHTVLVATGGAYIRLLGQVSVAAGGRVVELGPVRQQAVFATLVLKSPQPVSADQVLESVWGERSPVTGRAVVHSYVHRLRKILGDVVGITSSSQGYVVRLGAAGTDLERVALLSAEAAAAKKKDDWAAVARLLADAIALWAGDPLSGLPGPFIEAHRDRLREQWWELTGRRVEADLALGRHYEVLPELTELVRSRPLREDLRRHQMIALYRTGRTADALAEYDDTRRVLADHLGVEPGPELRELHQRLLNHDAALMAPMQTPALTVPAQLPADLADFTGRADEVAALCAMLSRPDAPARTAVVSGSGGIGKTTLVVHVAHRVRHLFPDGQVYLNLGGLDEHPVDVGVVLADLLEALGVRLDEAPVGVTARAALLRSVLARRRVLLVLDNAGTAAQVRPLLPGSSGNGVLITSRSPLAGLTEVPVWTLSTLPVPDARVLLDRIVGAARTADGGTGTAAVLDVCAGLPLAIRIAGSRLAARPEWSVAALADRLRRHHSTLDELTVGDVSVRASVAVSYDALVAGGARERAAARAFQFLGLTAGPSIGPDAAAALLGVPPDQMEPVLDVLVDVHLLALTGRRYRAHDLVRLFAAERVAEERPEDRRAAVARLLGWYLHTASAAARVVGPNRSHVELGAPPAEVVPQTFAGYDDALTWLIAEAENLVAAIEQAAAHDHLDIAWQLPIELWDLAFLRNAWTSLAATHRIGLRAAQRLGNRRAEAWLLNNLSGAYQVLDQLDDAVECLHRAVEVNRELGDDKTLGTNLYNLALVDLTRDEFSSARTRFQQALDLHRSLGYRYGVAAALAGLADVHWRLGEHRTAITWNLRVLALQRAIGDRTGVVAGLNSLARCCLALGDPVGGEQYAREALAAAREARHQHGEAWALRSLGTAAHHAGRPDEARDLWRQAVRIFEEIGHEDLEQTLAMAEGSSDPVP